MLEDLESAAIEAAIRGSIGRGSPLIESPDGACRWFASDAASDSGRVGSCWEKASPLQNLGVIGVIPKAVILSASKIDADLRHMSQVSWELVTQFLDPRSCQLSMRLEKCLFNNLQRRRLQVRMPCHPGLFCVTLIQDE